MFLHCTQDKPYLAGYENICCDLSSMLVLTAAADNHTASHTVDDGTNKPLDLDDMFSPEMSSSVTPVYVQYMDGGCNGRVTLYNTWM